MKRPPVKKRVISRMRLGSLTSRRASTPSLIAEAKSTLPRRVGVVDVEVGEGADLARDPRGSTPTSRTRMPPVRAVGAVDEEQPAVGVDPEAVRGAEGLAPGLDLPRVIGVLHADDVEAPGRLRRGVDVFAVGPDLAPLAVRRRRRAATLRGRAASVTSTMDVPVERPVRAKRRPPAVVYPQLPAAERAAAVAPCGAAGGRRTPGRAWPDRDGRAAPC